MNQGRIERFILDSIRDYSDLEVERGIIAESLEYDEGLENDPDAYPITVKIQVRGDDEPTQCGQQIGPGLEALRSRSNLNRLDAADLADSTQHRRPKKTQFETIKAKYLIGCDGAHSWTRKQLDIPVEGSNTDHIWLVIPIPIPCYSNLHIGLYRGVIDVVPLSDFRKSSTAFLPSQHAKEKPTQRTSAE